jgi:hypothetical protein
MTYRDDLEAAHARIAALEAELADRKRPTPPPKPAPTVKRDALALARLPTLDEHNRTGTQYEQGIPAGVRCPACAAQNYNIEMMVGHTDETYFTHYVSVACPRCLLSGYRRCTEAEKNAFLRASGHEDLANETTDAFEDAFVDWSADDK